MTDDLYYKVGVGLDEDFFLATPAAPSGLGGETANFSVLITKNGVGGVSTTGFTISQISSTVNPGMYHVSVGATTGFVANTGEYTAKIAWSTDPTYQFPKTYRVNSNGLPTGTSGDVSFTAAASDGRITDGTSALTGATIYFTTPTLVPYASLTSSATGVWGPIYFPTTGTWPFTVQLAGYSVGTGNITVTSVATGPLADVALTAVSSGSTITVTGLKTHARQQVRGAVGTAADSMILAAINDALGMVAKEHRWSWLATNGDLTFQTYYSTGTIAISSATPTIVTLTTGTWPTWAASGKLYYAGQLFRVSLRTSATQIVLTTSWAGATFTGGAFVIYQNEYTLPTDCLVFGKAMPGSGWGWGPDPVAFSTLADYENTFVTQSSTPQLHAVKGNKLVVWPYPALTRNWPIYYYRKPAELVNNTDTADWDPLQLEVFRRAIDFQLALRFGPVMHGTTAECERDYRSELNKTVANDKEKAPRRGIDGGGYTQSIKDRTLPSPF